MRLRLLSLLCVTLALGAAGLAAFWWTEPPAPELALPPPEAPTPPVPATPEPEPGPAAQEAGLAAQAWREQLEALARAPQGLQQLTALYAQSAEGARREQVLGAVALVGDGAAVAWLAEVARRDERLAAHAAQALGSVQDRRAAPALAKALRQPGPVHLRANAARALGRAGGRAQAPLLLGRVADGREQLRVRQEAALALAQVGRAKDVRALTRLLEQLGGRQDAASRQLRLSLVQALGGIGGGAAREALLRHARRPLPEAEQAFVRQALARG